MILNEGGNVFKDEKKLPLTRRINRDEIPGTINFLERITGLDLKDAPLGSTGVAASSGDVDLAIDANLVTKPALQQALVNWCKSQQIPEDQIVNTSKFEAGWIKPAADLHFKCPIEGDAKKGFAQVDFMFLNNMAWSRWILGAMPADSKYKGVDRFILLNSIGKPLNVKIDGKRGALDRTTNEIVTTDPAELARILLNPLANVKDLASVESIVAALRNDPKRKEKLADAMNNFASRGIAFPELAENVHPDNWYRNLLKKID